MSLFRLKGALPEVSSTPFSEFIRTASSEEKKKVYSKVLKRASEQQNEILAHGAQEFPGTIPQTQCADAAEVINRTQVVESGECR
jgi:hypothetical protein